MSRRAIITLAVLAALLAAAIVLRLAVGGRPPEAGTLGIRVDRVLSSIIVGAALATGGVLLQSLLKNPLASPDLIGAASGAGLAVMLAIYLTPTSNTSFGPSMMLHGPAALAGSIGALAVVYMLAQRRGFIEPVSLVLIGVIVSIICGAATLFVAFLVPSQTTALTRWTVGAISDEAYGWPLRIAGLVTLAAILLAMTLTRAMDVASLGDDEAQSSGVNIARLRLALFALSGVLTAVAVVLAGPIGFVGLVCPHVVRLLAGPGHRVVLPGAAVAGATLILFADASIKAVNLSTGRMPIGIITALVGGPVFIVLLRRESGRADVP